MTLETLWGSKVDVAIRRLQEFEPEDGYFLAFSGGKDSQAIYHLAKEAGVKFEAHYSVTTVDPPELMQFIKREYPDVIWDKPNKGMYRLIIDHGMPPTRRARYCCDELKEDKGEGHIVVTGVRWAESHARAKRGMLESCYKQHKSYLHAIIDWTDTDVWAYHERLGIPHCALYDEGHHRIGCVLCPLNRHRLDEVDRWPAIVRMYKLACQKAYERRLERGDEMTWQSGKDMYEWWISDESGHSAEDDGQLNLFA